MLLTSGPERTIKVYSRTVAPRLTFSLKAQIFNSNSQPWLDMGLPEECLQVMAGDYVSDRGRERGKHPLFFNPLPRILKIPKEVLFDPSLT